MKSIKKETETEIIIEGNLELTEDFKTDKKLTVTGNIFGKDNQRFNINARDIKAWEINAGNIKAWDIKSWEINAGNINARDIKAWEINAGNIKAWDIICNKRIKKSKQSKTIARIFIKNTSSLKIKEWQ